MRLQLCSLKQVQNNIVGLCMHTETEYLKFALELAYQNVLQGGRPFAAIIVKDEKVLATAVNEIHLTQDPTAHAELLSIRRAGQILQTQDLQDCVIFATGQPCPMCLALMHMTGIQKAIYAYSNQDAEAYQLSTAAIYQQMQHELSDQNIHVTYLPVRLPQQPDLYQLWSELQTSQ